MCDVRLNKWIEMARLIHFCQTNEEKIYILCCHKMRSLICILTASQIKLILFFLFHSLKLMVFVSHSFILMLNSIYNRVRI